MPRRENLRPAPPPARRLPPRRRGAGGTLLGVFIGLVLGLSLAAGVAYYLMRGGGIFAAAGGAKESREAAREPAKVAKAERAEPGAEKPRFDFYKILPGVEEPKVQAEAKKAPDRAVVESARDKGTERPGDKGADKAAAKGAEKGAEKGPERAAPAEQVAAAKLPERFWLQAGSFASEADAENLKARLALAGWQASIQQGALPDKGVRYRVRLGPYDNTDELNRIRGDLTKGGFDVAVIKF